MKNFMDWLKDRLSEDMQPNQNNQMDDIKNKAYQNALAKGVNPALIAKMEKQPKPGEKIEPISPEEKKIQQMVSNDMAKAMNGRK